MTIPTPAEMLIPTESDEALAREIIGLFGPHQSYAGAVKRTEQAAQLIAAHVAAQAPSGLVEALEKISKLNPFNVVNAWEIADTALAAHKAQPVADVRVMVELLEEALNELRPYRDERTRDDEFAEHDASIDELKTRIKAALASAQHATGGEVKA